MNTDEFLSHLQSLRVNLWVDGDDLRYSAPGGALTPGLRAELLERKAEILEFLRALDVTADLAAFLSQTGGAGPEPGEAFVAPRTALEEVLAGIWKEVLGVEKVGVHDNFFELGGNSLEITQVTSRVRDAFQVDLPPATLLQAQTVGGLAVAMLEGSKEHLEIEKTAALLLRVARLSEEEVEAMLANELAPD